jgi:hypothetical protein
MQILCGSGRSATPFAGTAFADSAAHELRRRLGRRHFEDSKRRPAGK